jgi:branched-chain amino acid transport system substrate-binding protein
VKESDPQKAVIMKYKTEYEKRFKAGVSTFGGHAYDAINMLVDALKAVGTNKEKIRVYLETKIKNWPGTGGVFNMSPQDHTGLDKSAFVMIVVKNGDWAFAN